MSTRRINRPAAVIFAASIVAFAVLCATDPSSATEAPTAEPGGITAVWYAAGTNQWPTEGQTLKVHQPSTALDTDFVQATAALLGCGFTIQGDYYADDATTAALLAGGKLYAPGSPTESWPGGQYLPEFSTVFYTGDCVAPVPTETPAPVESTPPTETGTRADVVTGQVAAKAAAPELAQTGIDIANPFAGGFLLLLGGALLLSISHMRKRESK
jgi:hypothetical protein